MFKILRNFIIGLLIGGCAITLLLPYVFFRESPTVFYPNLINQQLRQNQDTKQLARFFDESGTRLPILTYRQFAEENEEGEAVEPGITLSQFEEQMRTLADIGCTFITPQTLLNAINGKEPLPPRAVLITFDDCSKEIYTQAFPILKKYNIHATVNVIGYYVQFHDNYDFPLLTWEEIGEMADSGLIDFQSETYYSYVPQLNVDGSTTYPFSQAKPGESAEAYQMRVSKDLLRNNLKLWSEIGQPPIALAYPYGASSATTTQAMKDTGLVMGFDSANNTCLNLLNWVDPYHLPRFEMNQNFKRMQDFVVFINNY